MELKDVIMQLIPEEECNAAGELIEDFEQGDPEDFYDKYPELVNGYEDMQVFLDEIEESVICLGTVLTWYLMERGILLLVNWEGEEEENLLADYVNYRLESLGGDFSVETESFYHWAEATDYDRADGNLVWGLLQAVDQQLRAHGFCLLGIDTQCEPENIYVGVFPKAVAEGVLRTEVDDVYLACAEDL